MKDDDDELEITREKLLEHAKRLATPMDFDDLIAQGILERKGRRYKILSIDRLPQHARDKITEISTDGTVKFSNATKSAEKLVKKLSR